MRGKQPEKAQRTKKANCRPTQSKWHEMNRKQRREVMRKMQSEDISLEVVHPDAAGIDIGNEAHYVAVPPGRDSQPVRRFGCTTAEIKELADWLTQCGIRTVAMQSTGDNGRSLSDRDGPIKSGWCAGRHRPPASAWRSSDGACGDKPSS
jgi:hypothetical protein